MRKILYFAFTALLLGGGFASCNKHDDDSGKRNTHFDAPELTALNTIQFTVNTRAGDYAYIMLQGGKIAVDWGDGEITKDVNPENGEAWRSEFTHVYKKAGAYEVKIWSDEVSLIYLSSLLKDYGQLHVGNCPALKNANFNSFLKDKTLDLNGCANLETLNLGNWEQLESVTLDKCSRLNEMQIYTNPNLKALDVSKNSKLHSLDSRDNGLEEWKLPGNIVNINCSGNNFKSITLEDYKELKVFGCSDNKELTSLNLTGCEKLNIIQFSNTQVASFDFSEFPGLHMIYCGNTKLTNVDVTGCKDLGNLYCQNLGLASLDIANNPYMSVLDCSGNGLTTLDVSKNKAFRYLYINGNHFDKDELETIFKALPKFDPASAKSMPTPPPPPSEIKIYDNPGAAACDTKIITDKGWVVKNILK